MTFPPDDFDPPIGIAQHLEPGLRRIVAPNPSPMTYRGTNTYLVGDRDLAVIDPGPADAQHLQAILNSVAPDHAITHIVVTHAHLDHSPLAAELSRETDAPIYAFGDAKSGRSAVMQDLVGKGMVGGGEGVHEDFRPDVSVGHGDVIEGNTWSLDVIHTPGHFGNHIALGWNNACFTADHVMGWASSLVSPPDGDLTDFMLSCQKLRRYDWRIFYPGHGSPIDTPKERLDWLISHRHAREAAILDALNNGAATATKLTQQIYTDTNPALMGAAARNVFAHLVDLVGKGLVEPIETLDANATFLLSPKPATGKS